MMTPKTVAVIGLGLMGSALARAFANAGYELSVWNRTPEKARPFAGRAHIADSVRDACASSACVVVSLLDYGASDDVMHRADVEKALPGKLLVQLTTGTPNEARHGEAWARRHDIGYLDGAIMGYPRSIGAERMTILYAGPKAIFDENVALLRVLGGNAVYCGEPIGQPPPWTWRSWTCSLAYQPRFSTARRFAPPSRYLSTSSSAGCPHGSAESPRQRSREWELGRTRTGTPRWSPMPPPSGTSFEGAKARGSMRRFPALFSIGSRGRSIEVIARTISRRSTRRFVGRELLRTE